MFWICDSNGVGNTPLFRLFLRSACTVSAPCFPIPPPASRWQCARSWEGTQQEQLTQNDQKDIPCHEMSWSAVKCKGRGFWGKQPLLKNWLGLGLHLGGGKCLYITCFLFVFFFLLSLSFAYKTISTPESSCFCSTYSLPCPKWEGKGKWTSICVVLSCLPWLTNSRKLPLSDLGTTMEFVI